MTKAKTVETRAGGKSVQQIARKLDAKEKLDSGDELTDEDRAALGEPVGEDADEAIDDPDDVESKPADAGPPEWAAVPSDLILPKGKQIYFIRIKAEWTDRPNEGDRQCIAWNLNVADEDLALKRTRGEQTRVTRECCMMMVRAIDGHKADWTGGNANSPGNVRRWFDIIGPKGRMLLQNVYLRTHSVDTEVALRFFADCFASMSSV